MTVAFLQHVHTFESNSQRCGIFCSQHITINVYSKNWWN